MRRGSTVAAAAAVTRSPPTTVGGYPGWLLWGCESAGVIPNVPETAQAVQRVVTCTTTWTSGETSGRENVVVNVRVRRVECDRSIDSDGGGRGDCEEYERLLNPNDPSDDASQGGDSDNDGRLDRYEGGGSPPGVDTDGDGNRRTTWTGTVTTTAPRTAPRATATRTATAPPIGVTRTERRRCRRRRSGRRSRTRAAS